MNNPKSDGIKEMFDQIINKLILKFGLYYYQDNDN